MDIIIIVFLWISSLIASILVSKKYGGIGVLIVLGAVFFSWAGMLISWLIAYLINGGATQLATGTVKVVNNAAIAVKTHRPPPIPTEVIKIRCLKCRDLQSEGSKFCSTCGNSL